MTLRRALLKLAAGRLSEEGLKMSWEERIEQNRHIMAGKPRVIGTLITVELVMTDALMEASERWRKAQSK